MTARDPGEARLRGRRVLVVGASAGIGRACAVAATREGARVGLVARRRERLNELVAEMGDGTTIEADVREASDCDRALEEVVDAFGGLDAVVYAAAVTCLGGVAEADAQVWNDVIATNLVGASLVLRAALPHLATSGGRALILSSDSVAYPFPGLGPYAASKAALDTLILAWRGEHPEIDVVRVIVGPTVTEAASAWDPETAARFFEVWAARGFLRDDVIPQQAEAVADRLVELLATDDPPEDVELFPPGMPSTLG